MKNTILLFVFILVWTAGCQQATTASADQEASAKETATIQTQPAKRVLATSLVKAIDAHGGRNYDHAYYSFLFRGKTYTFNNNGGQFIYTRQQTKEGKSILDSLTNDGVARYIDGEKQLLNDKQKASYSEGINSVIYFATLPHKLQDPAVNATALDTIEIKEQSYTVLEVTFDQEGGGSDFEDNYRYWINNQSNRIDYLAYDYRVNGGGVRFRSAYNPRVVDGILFQDYINYKAPVGTNLDDLPNMFVAGELKELSRIETEEINNLDGQAD